MWFFFFFKQKTAYEMRISDWSSDVCSSDLAMDFDQRAHGFLSITLLPSRNAGGGDNATTSPSFTPLITSVSASATVPVLISRRRAMRSEERRVGHVCVCTCTSRWSPYH